MVAIALIAEPRLLILDEPTTGLDPRSRREVWELIRHLTARGTTTLITAHYMDEAEALCERIAFIGNGRLLAEGSTDELRASLGSNFKATYKDQSGQERVIVGETHHQVINAVESLEVVEFSITRTSLEDLFLQLTNGEGDGGRV